MALNGMTEYETKWLQTSCLFCKYLLTTFTIRQQFKIAPSHDTLDKVMYQKHTTYRVRLFVSSDKQCWGDFQQCAPISKLEESQVSIISNIAGA